MTDKRSFEDVMGQYPNLLNDKHEPSPKNEFKDLFKPHPSLTPELFKKMRDELFKKEEEAHIRYAMLSALKEVAQSLEDVADVPQSVYDAIKLAEGR